MIPVEVRDNSGVEIPHELLGRSGQGDKRISARVRGVLDWWTRTDFVEHRIDEHAPPSDLQEKCGVGESVSCRSRRLTGRFCHSVASHSDHGTDERCCVEHDFAG
jgi:hypothetical protein